jgi:hypothetical protein
LAAGDAVTQLGLTGDNDDLALEAGEVLIMDRELGHGSNCSGYTILVGDERKKIIFCVLSLYLHKLHNKQHILVIDS